MSILAMEVESMLKAVVEWQYEINFGILAVTENINDRSVSQSLFQMQTNYFNGW